MVASRSIPCASKVRRSIRSSCPARSSAWLQTTSHRSLNHEDFRQALYLIAHECGHIEELHCRDERFPGTILQTAIMDYEEALLAPIIESLWAEYAACHLSAIFGEEQVSAYEECFIGALNAARNEANAGSGGRGPDRPYSRTAKALSNGRK